MARTTIRLGRICPADLIADTDAIPDDAWQLFDADPRALEKLYYTVAAAITAQLPDELIVTGPLPLYDGDGGEPQDAWDVMQVLEAGTAKIDWRPLQDAATDGLRDAIAWMSDARLIAEIIDLDTLVHAAVRDAQNAAEADA